MGGMVVLAQVNLVVADAARSRRFYEALGIAFAPRHRAGVGRPEAGVSTNCGTTLVLHSVAFASWWDESGPRPSAGSSQVDLELDSVAELVALVERLRAGGAPVHKEPTDMPWRQTFAILLDPDGHRVGLKAPRSS